MNIDDLNTEIKKLEEMKLKLLEEEKETKKLNDPIVLTCAKLAVDNFLDLSISCNNALEHNETLDFIRLLSYRNDIRVKFYPYDSKLRVYAGDMERFFILVENLTDLKFAFGREVSEELAYWKEPPDWKVNLVDQGILLTAKPGLNVTNIGNIPGALLKRSSVIQYILPLAESWRLIDIIPPSEVNEWTPEAIEYVEKLVNRRKFLDELALHEDVEIPEYANKFENGFTLKPYQRVGVKFAEATGYNCIIADKMGLGKSLQAISATKMMDLEFGQESKYLFIVPTGLKPNWESEFYKFLGIRPYDIFGSDPSTEDIVQILKGNHKYFLAGYDAISTVYADKKETVDTEGFKHNTTVLNRPWIKLLNLASFTAVIVDEVHKIKNIDSKRSQAVRELNCERKILLSGTLLINRPGELWPPINFLDSKLVGPYETFLKRYTIDNKVARNVDELRNILKPIMIRRRTEDVYKDLQPINRIVRKTTLTSDGRILYDKALEGLWMELKDWEGNFDDNNSQHITNLLAQIMKLKQVCAWDNINYVADLATELADSLVDSPHNKVITFTQFVNTPDCVNQIARRLGDQGCLTITGEQHPSDRQKIVKQFQEDPSIKHIVCSIFAAGEGLTMTQAGAVIFNDMTWTPASHHQAEWRAYGRTNDPHPIDSYYILSSKTITEEIWQLLELKLAIFNEIIEGTGSSRDVSIAMELLKKLKERGF